LFAPGAICTGSPVAEYEVAPVPMIDDRPMSSGVVPGLDTTRSDDFDVPI
jgi:hypothetical protein